MLTPRDQLLGSLAGFVAGFRVAAKDVKSVSLSLSLSLSQPVLSLALPRATSSTSNFNS